MKRVKVSEGLRDMVRKVLITGVGGEVVIEEDLKSAVVQGERH